MSPHPASDILQWIEALNRKERYWLVRQATEGRFRLDAAYRADLEGILGISTPPDAYTAMDYHLDWLATSVVVGVEGRGGGVPFPNQLSIDAPVMTGNQEDIDLLVAFTAAEDLHVILVEAKFDSGWTNSQMTSKARRLRAIFGDDGDRVPHVIPHFVITSPRRPPRLVSDEWPAWMNDADGYRWIELSVSAGRIRSERTDGSGRASRVGEYVTLKSVRVPRDARFEVSDGDLEFVG